MRDRSRSSRPEGSTPRSVPGFGPSVGPLPVRRRRFLKTLCSVPVAAAAVTRAAGEGEARRSDEADRETSLPHIPLGPHRISRLVCGANPFHAGSHLSVFVNHEMRAYYTPAQTLKTLRRCEEVGINCWQGNGSHVTTYRTYREQGGKLQYISLGREEKNQPRELKELREAGCIAVAHHGEVTDRLFKDGKLDQIHDYLKKVRDAGLVVGVSTHMPDVVDAVESKNWDVDFYMTCVYERHRSAEELKRLLGHVPIPVGEVYLEEDPPRMFEAVRQTRRTCLAFKILAAGRLSNRKGWVEKAFRQTFESIKPTDGVIVGIYDRYSDQPAENAAYTRRFSRLSGAVGRT